MCCRCKCICRLIFLLTHLLRGATAFAGSVVWQTDHFYSRTSCEVRLAARPMLHPPLTNFYTRPSCEVRHITTPLTTPTSLISTHAPLARCDQERLPELSTLGVISTHAPLARCDCRIAASASMRVAISTHAPLARCDQGGAGGSGGGLRFLLTHLLRGATRTTKKEAIK